MYTVHSDIIISNNNEEEVASVLHPQLTYRQPVQNGVLTDQLCRAIYCIHLSVTPMQIAITIT